MGEIDCSSLTEGVWSVPAASSSPTSESSAIQIIEATLNNSSSASAESPSGSAAALPVTQQMTEMSISCEDEGVLPKIELPEPGWYFCFRLEEVSRVKTVFRIES